MKLGYARVSTRDQDPQLQLDALEAAGCDKVLTEKASGRSRNRPVLEAALEMLGEGDELVVWKIDRLGRSTIDLATIFEDLNERGIAFRSLTQPELSTTGPTGKLVRTIVGAVAEYERELIAERVANGIAQAQRNGTRTGRPFGRPHRLTEQDEDEILGAWNDTSVTRLKQRYKVSERTIYRARDAAIARQENHGKR
jgi:DNA invertase Pin-like site-specific DNA recombinase